MNFWSKKLLSQIFFWFFVKIFFLSKNNVLQKFLVYFLFSKNILVQKKVWSKKNVNQKIFLVVTKFLVQKNFWSKKFLAEKKIGPKKFWSKFFLSKQNFWLKHIFGPKQFLTKISFGPKKFVVRKSFGPKNFGPKIVLVQTDLGGVRFSFPTLFQAFTIFKNCSWQQSKASGTYSGLGRVARFPIVGH